MIIDDWDCNIHQVGCWLIECDFPIMSRLELTWKLQTWTELPPLVFNLRDDAVTDAVRVNLPKTIDSIPKTLRIGAIVSPITWHVTWSPVLRKGMLNDEKWKSESIC